MNSREIDRLREKLKNMNQRVSNFPESFLSLFEACYAPGSARYLHGFVSWLGREKTNEKSQFLCKTLVIERLTNFYNRQKSHDKYIYVL